MGGCRYHQYKFIVDGEWRHDEAQPFMPDPLGNVNNWLFVRRHEGPHHSGWALAVDLCSAQMTLANVCCWAFMPDAMGKLGH